MHQSTRDTAHSGCIYHLVRSRSAVSCATLNPHGHPKEGTGAEYACTVPKHDLDYTVGCLLCRVSVDLRVLLMVVKHSVKLRSPQQPD